MTEQNVDSVAESLAKKAMQLPPSMQFALITVLPNICNGAFWGFTDTETCREFAEGLKADKCITLRKLSDGKNVLVEIMPDYLVKIANTIGGLIDAQLINEMRNGMAEGQAQFEKFLITKGSKGFRGAVGIYCTNDSSAITYRGQAYPAFRVNIGTALELMRKWGFCFVINKQAVLPEQAANMGTDLYRSLLMSPTNTGVFCNIASTLTPEQFKTLKQHNGVK